MNMNQIASDLYNAITEADAKKPKPYDTKAEVLRVDGETVWVKIPGGIDETPVARTNNANAGDQVMVRISGGRAWLLGNQTNPATDDSVAIQAGESAGAAMERASNAAMAAEVAEESANTAMISAAQAVQDALIAKNSADSAFASAQMASTSATEASEAAAEAASGAQTAGRAASIAQAAADAAQGDIDELENWFYHDTFGSHVLGTNSGYRLDSSATGINIVENSTEKVISQFAVGQIVLGLVNSAIRNVITNTSMAFQTDSGDLAYFGLNNNDIWEMFINQAHVTDMLMFGDYAFITRQNGNLTLKWLGE